MLRTVNEEAVSKIPDVRLKLLNMGSGKKYSSTGMDAQKRSNLRPVSEEEGIVVDFDIPRVQVIECSTWSRMLWMFLRTIGNGACLMLYV
jgi:hypothetical protein